MRSGSQTGAKISPLFFNVRKSGRPPARIRPGRRNDQLQNRQKRRMIPGSIRINVRSGTGGSCSRTKKESSCPQDKTGGSERWGLFRINSITFQISQQEEGSPWPGTRRILLKGESMMTTSIIRLSRLFCNQKGDPPAAESRRIDEE